MGPQPTRKGFSLHAPPADDDRRCGNCGDYIDPIDWCAKCRKAGAPCRSPHKRLRKRQDAKFCDAVCRANYRHTFQRDCL